MEGSTPQKGSGEQHPGNPALSLGTGTPRQNHGAEISHPLYHLPKIEQSCATGTKAVALYVHKFLSNGAGEAAAAVAMATVAVATGTEAVMTCPQAAGGFQGRCGGPCLAGGP